MRLFLIESNLNVSRDYISIRAYEVAADESTSSSRWWNPAAIAASLISPDDLELTPFRAYSAIYYGHTRCSNNCANAQHEITCIRKSSVIVSSRDTRVLFRVSYFSFLNALLLRFVSSFSLPLLYASLKNVIYPHAYAIFAANHNIRKKLRCKGEEKVCVSLFVINTPLISGGISMMFTLKLTSKSVTQLLTLGL